MQSAIQKSGIGLTSGWFFGIPKNTLYGWVRATVEKPSIWVSVPIHRKVLMPAICMPELVTVPDDLSTAFDFILYKSAEEAVIKALGAN